MRRFCRNIPQLFPFTTNRTILLTQQIHDYNKGDYQSIYDTIRYDTVDLRALKSWRDGQLNLVHGPETKNNEKKIKNQKPSSSEETVQAKVRGV